MQYLNIIIPAALVIYLAYRMYQHIQLGVTDNLLLQAVTLAVALAILIFRVIQFRKRNS